MLPSAARRHRDNSVTSFFIFSLLLSFFLFPAAEAGRKSDMVDKLLQAERVDDAQRLCRKWKADRPDVLPELRIA